MQSSPSIPAQPRCNLRNYLSTSSSTRPPLDHDGSRRDRGRSRSRTRRGRYRHDRSLSRSLSRSSSPGTTESLPSRWSDNSVRSYDTRATNTTRNYRCVDHSSCTGFVSGEPTEGLLRNLATAGKARAGDVEEPVDLYLDYFATSKFGYFQQARRLRATLRHSDATIAALTRELQAARAQSTPPPPPQQPPSQTPPAKQPITRTRVPDTLELAQPERAYGWKALLPESQAVASQPQPDMAALLTNAFSATQSSSPSPLAAAWAASVTGTIPETPLKPPSTQGMTRRLFTH